MRAEREGRYGWITSGAAHVSGAPMFPLVSDKIDSVCNSVAELTYARVGARFLQQTPPVIVINEPLSPSSPKREINDFVNL